MKRILFTLSFSCLSYLVHAQAGNLGPNGAAGGSSMNQSGYLASPDENNQSIRDSSTLIDATNREQKWNDGTLTHPTKKTSGGTTKTTSGNSKKITHKTTTKTTSTTSKKKQ
ncbi:MAG TPA: hypothetical protein VK750_08700 [Cytophagaceae bacterium]|jgi:hypothetical protein|nr:hypothetical protein [Cytophagaceae bacterium]